MQQSINKQLDDKVSGKIDQTVPRTVRSILSADLNPMTFKKNKRQKSKLTSSNTNGNIHMTITEGENENTHTKKQQTIL